MSNANVFPRLRLLSGLVCGALALTGFAAASLAQQAPTGVGLSPADYPLRATPGVAEAPRLPVPFTVTAQAPTPSPIAGQKPPLPLSLPHAEKARQNPALLDALQSSLAPVASGVNPAPGTLIEIPPPPGAQGRPAATPSNAPASGSWVLGPSAGVPLSNPLLLQDGSVIAHQSCTGNWYKLTPALNGASYSAGTWTQIATMPAGYAPRFFSSAVLPDGRVIVEGGEYNNTGSCASAWTNLGAIYDPLLNTWTSVSPPAGWTHIGDAQSTVLANGIYMQASCCAIAAALFNPSNLTWTTTGTGKADVYDEEGWTLLPNNKVLTVDAYVSTGTCGTRSEVYDPTTGAWTTTGSTVSILADCSNPTSTPSYEMGPQVLRTDGSVVAFGANTCYDGSSLPATCTNGTFVVTTPTNVYSSSSGVWSAGPNVPAVSGKNYGLADAPAVLLPNGNILFAASPNYQAFTAPTHFFEMAPASSSNTITQVSDPTDAASFIAFQWNFLMLPNGNVLALETDGSNVWIYNSNAQLTSAAPTITSAPTTVVPGGVYTISGTQLNGLTQGAYYGDDQEAATNYPIVFLYHSLTNNWYLARATNPTSSSVTPGLASSVTVTFPEGLPEGPLQLYVGASGFLSNPTNVNVVRSTSKKAPDFNNDGKTDILWRSRADGTLAMWQMNGSAISGSNSWGLSQDWTVIATGDFFGDGNCDILFRNNNGTVSYWRMNGSAIVSSGSFGVISSQWVVVGTGDFNGDGTSDIVWRNMTDGTVVIWQMANGAISQSASWAVSLNWTIAAVGNFYGDAKSAILWRAADGSTALWRMSGLSITSSAPILPVGSPWDIAAVGDFNKDGTTDIVWRNYSTGDVAIWMMNNGTISSSLVAGTVSLNWTIAGAGDFNGDGQADLLWRDMNTGSVAVWLMANGAISSSALVATISSTWSLSQ
jgi:FG-GAP-like repeat